MIRTRFVLPFWPLTADSANQGATSLTPIAAVLAAGLFSLTPIAATAATIQVGVKGCTLANAIRNANSIFDADGPSGCALGSLLGTDTITLPASSAQPLTAVLPSISSVITIHGNGATVRRNPRGPDFRIFTVTKTGNLTLNDVTVSGGLATSPSPPTRGGGILSDGAVTLNRSTVSGSIAQDGGGVFVGVGGTVTLNSSTVSGNSAEDGGGLKVGGGTLTLKRSVVSDNTAQFSGGGVFNAFGTTSFTNSTVSGNSAEQAAGGGVIVYGGIATATFTNSTVSGNDGSEGGGVASPHPSRAG